MQRPDTFTIDPHHHLANGLVFAGLGANAGSGHYHDSSLYGLHGSLTGATLPTWKSVQSVVGIDVSLGGYASTPGCTIGSQYTISWLHSWTTSAASRDVVLSGTGGTALTNEIAIRHISASYRTFYHYGDSDGASTITFASAGAIFTGDRRCSLVSRVGADYDVYVDGTVRTDSESFSTDKMSLADGLHIGVDADTSTYGFNGVIADVLVHNRVLSDSEIQQIADPSNVMLSGLIQLPARKWFAVASTPAASQVFPILSSSIIR